MRFLIAFSAAALLAIPSTSEAVTLPRKCSAVDTTQVKATKITVSKLTGCKSGRLVVHHWMLANFSKAKVTGYTCVFDTHGAHVRRGHCSAAQGKSVAFTLTEHTPDR